MKWSFLVLIFCCFLVNPLEAREAHYKGTSVFNFKVRYGSVTPTDRAELLEKRMSELIQLQTFDPQLFRLEAEGDQEALVYDKTFLMVIGPEDASHEGKKQAALAQEILEKIKVTIEEERLKQEPFRLALAAGLVLLTTVLLVLGWRILGKLRDRMLLKAEDWSRSLQFRVLRRLSFFDEPAVKASLIFLVRAFHVVAIFLLVYFYIPTVFSFLPWTSGWSDLIFSYVLHPVRWVLDGFLNLVPNLFFMGVIVVLTVYILKFLRFIFNEIERGRLRIDGFYPDWAEPTYKLVRILIFLGAFIICFPYIPGSESTAFKGLSVFIGVLVSLGSSSAISNMVSGVVITYMRPFKVGDMVKIADTMGEVVGKNLLVTRVCTLKKMEVTIPNSMILSSHINNYSAMTDKEGLILHTTVNINYDVPWPLVHEKLLEAAERTEFVLQEPKPFILQTALKDFNVAYELNIYTRNAQRILEIYSDLHANIQLSFAEAHIEIMSPHFVSLREDEIVKIPKFEKS